MECADAINHCPTAALLMCFLNRKLESKKLNKFKLSDAYRYINIYGRDRLSKFSICFFRVDSKFT